MKKKILLIAVLFMVTLLTGCGSKEKVVIYTSMEEERNQKLSEMVKKEFPELNVVIQHMATGRYDTGRPRNSRASAGYALRNNLPI